jgi:hypothetical protein
MTGPNPIAEALERDWQRIRHPHRHVIPISDGGTQAVGNLTTQTPAKQPATMASATAAAATKETPMSIITAIRNDIATIDAKLQAVDETALNRLDAVMANPEAAAVLSDLSGLAGIVGIPSGAIAGVAAGLKTLLSLYAPDQAAPSAPVGAPAQ